MKQPNGPQKLPGQVQHTIEVDPHPMPLGKVQDVGQTHAGHALGYHHQPASCTADVFRSSNVTVGLVAKARQRGRPLAQGEFEGGRRGQRGPQAQRLQQLPACVVDAQTRTPSPSSNVVRALNAETSGGRN